MMNRAMILRFLVIPLLAGLGVTLLVYHYTAPKATPKEPEVVTSAAIPAHTYIRMGMVQVAYVAKGDRGAGILSSPGSALGQVTAVPLVAGQPLAFGDLLVGTQDTMPFHIPAGTLAMTIQVNEFSGVGGLIKPGERVVVVASFPKGGSEGDRSQVLLENVPVLATTAGSTATAGAGSGAGGGGTYNGVTLALTPAAATSLALANQDGTISLALQPAGSTQVNQWPRLTAGASTP